MLRYPDLKRLMILSLLITVCVPNAIARETNYDESKVPEYTLPDPLVLSAEARYWNCFASMCTAGRRAGPRR